MKRFVWLPVFLLAGCAYNVTMMARDSGQAYTGEMNGSGDGTGTMTMRMGDVVCSGPVARIASGETFTIGTAYAVNNRGNSASGIATGVTSGDSRLKAILSCTNGTGIRCELTGRGASGGGQCMDDKGKIFDALAVRK